MAVTQVVFIYSTLPPFSLCATVLTDDNDHPGIPVLSRPECSPGGYTFNGLPCAAMALPLAMYQNLTVPIENDPTLAAAIAVAVNPVTIGTSGWSP